MRRSLAWCLCACACFSEPDVGGGGDGPDESSTGGPGTSATTTLTTTTGTTASEATSATTSTVDSGTTASDDATDDSPETSGESTAGGCVAGTAVPPHEGWMGPVALRTGMGEPAMPCPQGMGPAAWGLLDGETATCSCHCPSSPTNLCVVTVNSGLFDCSVAAFMPNDCQLVGGADHLWVDVEGASCTPSVALLEVPSDAPSLQACHLPPPTDGCVDVPRGFDGPCVIGGDGECPSGYEARDPFGWIQGCTSCAPGCSTAEYCASVVVTPYSAAGCMAGNALAPLEPGPMCQTNFPTDIVSVGFEGVGEPSCPDVPAASLPTNVCCVP